jgi:outer membrane lipoprotein SlyB
MTTPTPNSPTSAAATSTWNTPSLVMGGLGLLAIGALGAVLFLGNRSAAPEAPAAPIALVASLPEAASAPAPLLAAAPDGVAPAPAPMVAAPVAKAPPRHSTRPAATQAPSSAEPTPGVRQEAAAEPAPLPAPAPICASCGVVTAVTPVKQQGEAGALGTVAGGVLGGVLGHQVGGGHGKDAMTVIGAIGGAMAGREVEKRQRSTTVYEIQIRMDDGGSRRFTRDQAYAVGQKVRVEGDQLSLRN